jgi:uncharacterized membrane protein
MDFDDLIGWTIRLGLAISACILVAGSAFSYYGNGNLGIELTYAGVIILIATPVTRVAMSIALFSKSRNWLYVAITTVVFINLMIAIFLLPLILGK